MALERGVEVPHQLLPEPEARAVLRQDGSVAGEDHGDELACHGELQLRHGREAADRARLRVAQEDDRVLLLEVADELVPPDAEEQPVEQLEAGPALGVVARRDGPGLADDRGCHNGRGVAMKIALIMPQSEMYRRGGIFGKSLRYAPLTLTTLAALVPEELDAEIRIIDQGVEPLDVAAIDADLVGITCITANAPAVVRALRRAAGTRDHDGDRRGAPHARARGRPAPCRRDRRRLCGGVLAAAAARLRARPDAVPLRRVPGLPLRERSRATARPPPEARVHHPNTVQAVRGCPYRCNFCVVPVAWPRYLHRPVAEVIREIERLPGDTFLFLDLSPIEDPVYIKELYRALIPLEKRWGGLATIKIVDDPELLRLAVASGCRGLLIGLESVSGESIKHMRKAWSKPARYIEAIKKLHDHGIAINGCFVFGLDGDDPGIFERTVEFVDRAAIDLPRFAIATPFPGTPLYKQLEREGRLISDDWRLYGGQNVVFQPNHMTVDELQEGTRWAWRQVYGPRSIVRRVTRSGASRTPLVLKTSILANLGYTKYARLLPDYVPVPCEVEPWAAADVA